MRCIALTIISGGLLLIASEATAQHGQTGPTGDLSVVGEVGVNGLSGHLHWFTASKTSPPASLTGGSPGGGAPDRDDEVRCLAGLAECDD